jgi:hypothetical protein
MADGQTALRELLGKGSDATFLRGAIGFAAQRLVELEAGELTGAARGERSPTGWRSATATGNTTGKRGSGPSS